jgi:hypothetical protein
VTVEIAQHRPHLINGDFNDGRSNEGDLHRCP